MHSFRSMRRIEASRRNARAFRLRHSQSFANRRHRLSHADRITLVGLVFETASGLHRAVGPPLERQCELAGQDFEILIRLTRTPGGRLRMSDLAAQTDLTPSGLTRADRKSTRLN